MPSTRTHDILATVGRYKLEGKQMKRSVRVGSGFTDAQGRLFLRLDSVPICPEWSGWLSLFPVKKVAEETAPLFPPEEDVLCEGLGGSAAPPAADAQPWPEGVLAAPLANDVTPPGNDAAPEGDTHFS